ncbi:MULTISPECIES: hypothetical protein [Shewanella]|uniref:Lipoprotein n=1 Tax=Shewanella indica TaxID=768528 RepID=A0ABU4QCD7_9GAMM|nr:MULTISPECIES: hypothetical protein [Shewanella]OIN07304.1 hypothetical protein BFS86_17690 [Shewanella algae]BCV34766.1 hypothetical protein TUM17377_00940 [Shewanella chilikensis]MCE9791222.1 hypothetical protein [Shewanella indica]MDX6016205.1 hypothetical protein [Shewanella indica]NDO75848.1 hypothetical protein [Shewanella sp. SE1]
MRLPSTLAICLFLGACQAGNDGEIDAIADKNRAVKPLLPCGSGAPVVNRAKIKASLIERNIITQQMSEQEAEAKVSEYIQQRNQKFENCIKEPKS